MRKQGKTPAYAAFGTLLAARRVEAGIQHQSGLATLLGARQQTVSRWELGQSRPRFSQIGALAKAINVDPQELAAAAGYAPAPAVTSYDQPFPLEGLSPEAFERFCLYLVSALYPEGAAHRAGGQGHTQEGIDIDVEFEKGKRFHFQCKRVQEFGAAKVRAAVKALKSNKQRASRNVILLSRIASPRAREAVRAEKNWDIWDKEDIALRIRRLPKHEQVRLVDTFFRGQRLALLGETEPNVWQTADEFFAPFAGSHGAFTHAWKLVGRDEDAAKLISALESSSIRAVFLVGTAGAGKSRVLKQGIENFQRDNRGTLVGFLSPTEDITNKSLRDLGAGEKVLIVDDAHDRPDLKLLFQYAASPDNRAKIVLAFRPYGLDFIRTQASNFVLFGDLVAEIQLRALTLSDATSLAKEVLSKSSGPVHVAEDIAKLTRDCPLATVMGAWVVSKEKKHFEFAKNETEFRSVLMARFSDVIAGDVSPKDAGSIRKVLRIISLVQPFDVEDSTVVELCKSVEGLAHSEVKRLFRVLLEAGVLFRRGGAYRLSPDLLADYIIERECIGPNGASTGYAEQVFESANDGLLEHIVLNLGKLDWRRSNGDPSNSKLLDEIWRKLRPEHEYGDPHVRAVKAVAYYQPTRALLYVEDLMRSGEHLRDLPAIAKYAAYSLTHIRRSCECLWELGRNDPRQTGQNPEHAIRILSELGAVERNKPFEYNEAVVDFALSLFDRADSWTGVYCPLDILSGIAQTEGHSTTSDGRTVSFMPYQVRPDFVKPLRTKIIVAVLDLLPGTNLKAAVRAARFLQELLRFPMGMFNSKVADDVYANWSKEFVETLGAIRRVVQEHALDRVVLLEIARSVSWHAHYSKRNTSKVAKEILSLLPTDDLEFRTLLAVADPHGRIFDRSSVGQASDWTRRTKDAATELLAAYPEGEPLRATIERQMAHIAAGGSEAEPYTLYWDLLEKSRSFADATIENAIAFPASATARFVANALGKVLADSPASGLSVSRRLLGTGSIDFACAVGGAHGGFDFANDDRNRGHTALVRELLASEHAAIRRSAIRAVERIASQDKRLALDLVLKTDLSGSAQLIEDAFVLFRQGGVLSFDILTKADVEALFGKIALEPQLDGYWLQTFLSEASKAYARVCAAFFMRRVEHAADKQDWSFRASNHGPYENVKLQFRASPQFTNILKEVSHWLKSRTDYHFQHLASELFEVMFRPFDNEVLTHLDAWLDTANADDIHIIGSLLREADESFVFSQRTFVSRFLARARHFGKKVHERATYELYAAATTGMRSGLVGEPFPRDVNAKAEAESVLHSLSRFAPEFELYELIKDHSVRNISRSLREREGFEE